MNQCQCTCTKVLEEVLIEDVKLNLAGFPDARGMTFSCPSCHRFLGVEISPFWIGSLNDDVIVKKVAWRLQQNDAAAKDIQPE